MAVEEFPVERSHIMMFAYALGDDNPIYREPNYAATQGFEDLLAPPTFVAADVHFDPTSGLRRRKRSAPSGADGAAAAEGGGAARGGSGLHAEQHYEYHRPLRAGDVLTKTSHPGKSWEKEGRRAGKLLFSETISEYRDQDGELVLTTRMVGVRTERAVDA
jgi:hypothetical protein